MKIFLRFVYNETYYLRRRIYSYIQMSVINIMFSKCVRGNSGI